MYTTKVFAIEENPIVRNQIREKYAHEGVEIYFFTEEYHLTYLMSFYPDLIIIDFQTNQMVTSKDFLLAAS